MNKKLQYVLAILLALVLVFGSVGSASAKTDFPDCRITASTTTPVVGEPVQLTVKTSLSGPVSVYFGDGTEVQNGKSLWHTFRYVGYPIATAVVWFDNRSTIKCTFAFVVSDGVKPEGKPNEQNKNDDDKDNQSSSNSGSTTASATGSIIGDNNIAPVINGDNNKVIIKITKEEPMPVIVQSDPVVTQKTNLFTAFIHATLKAVEVFIHTVDESWFKPVLVK